MSVSSNGSEMHRDSPDVWVHPPVLFGVTLVAGLVINWWLGWGFGSFGAGLVHEPGWILAALGVLLSGGGILQFVTAGTNLRTDQPTHMIVTNGLYAYSRNPIYMGMIIFVAGLGLAFNAPFVLLLLVGAVLILRFGVIEAEEEYLEQKFGDHYLQYKSDVGRWMFGI